MVTRAASLSRSTPGHRGAGLSALARDAQGLALAPLGLALTAALRRAARASPDAFDRLGVYRGAVFIIAPTEAPVDFVMEPRGADGRIAVLPRDVSRLCVARISGPLLLLMGVFDGSLDADGAFFRREIRVEGDTEAMITLRNVMDAADFQLIDLVPTPAVLRVPLGRAVGGAAGFARRVMERAAQK